MMWKSKLDDEIGKWLDQLVFPIEIENSTTITNSNDGGIVIIWYKSI